MVSSGDDVVIFVHGTFANDKKKRDSGPRWWQRGSDNWRWFEDQLPDGARLPDESIGLFHWSGENSQADRFEASNRLLALMIELERQGRGRPQPRRLDHLGGADQCGSHSQVPKGSAPIVASPGRALTATTL